MFVFPIWTVPGSNTQMLRRNTIGIITFVMWRTFKSLAEIHKIAGPKSAIFNLCTGRAHFLEMYEEHCLSNSVLQSEVLQITLPWFYRFHDSVDSHLNCHIFVSSHIYIHWLAGPACRTVLIFLVRCLYYPDSELVQVGGW